MIAILVVSMVQGVFAQQIIIKGTVKDATSKKAAEYVNVVLQTADSVFVGGTTTNGKGDFLLNKASVTINPNFSGNTLTMNGYLVPYNESSVFQGTTW